MITFTATNTYATKGTHYIQAWANNTLKFWTTKIDIYFGKFFKAHISIFFPNNRKTPVFGT